MVRTGVAIISVFCAWVFMDFIMHGLILGPTYQSTPQIWRPMGEMITGLIYASTLIGAVCFVLIYALMIQAKSLAAGIQYGLLFGFGTGFSMGFGSYAVMPIPITLAVIWFLGFLCEATVAGLLTAAIIKPREQSSERVLV